MLAVRAAARRSAIAARSSLNSATFVTARQSAEGKWAALACRPAFYQRFEPAVLSRTVSTATQPSTTSTSRAIRQSAANTHTSGAVPAVAMDLLTSLVRRQSTKADATAKAASGASEEAASTAADASNPEDKSEATDEATGATGEDEQVNDEDDGEKDEDAKYEQEEALPIWQTILFLGLLGVGGWFGSYTIAELLPTATAPQSIRQRAFSLLEGDPEVNERFGKVARSYGAGYGSERGRRNFVQSYSYSQGGVKYTRIKFMVETDEKRRAVVYAEVDHKNPRAWSYVMLEPEHPRKRRRSRRRDVLVVEDNRKPVKPEAVRQSDVVSRLLTSGTRLYHGGPLDQHGQGQMKRLGPALTESMRGAVLVDCSRETEATRCEEVGFAKGQSPIWAFKQNARTVIKRQRVLELSELEDELGIND